MSPLIQMLVLTAAACWCPRWLRCWCPQARLERRWAPTLGAVPGFGLGLLGDLLVG